MAHQWAHGQSVVLAPSTPLRGPLPRLVATEGSCTLLPAREIGKLLQPRVGSGHPVVRPPEWAPVAQAVRPRLVHLMIGATVQASKNATSSPVRKVAIAAAAVVLTATAAVMGAAPAYANGSFSVKATPSACTEGDYSGTSYSSYSGGASWANASTSFHGEICVPGATSNVPGARAIAGTTMAAWNYSAGSVATSAIQKPNGSLTAYGHHSLGGGYLRNT